MMRNAASHGWFDRRRLAPLALLLAALAVLFPLFDRAGPLHRAYIELDHVTFNQLSVARNLSAEHGWLGFRGREIDADGNVAYEVYNRFPPLGYGLVKFAISTQPGDLAGQLQAARMLMLALYAGAALLAYLSLVQVVGRRWVALGATLTAFGSYATLRAADMVATEGTVDLFGTMLAFHGIAVYYGRSGAAGATGQGRRLGQLAAKICIALLLGWHVYALLAPFLGLGLAAALAGKNWAECRRLLALGCLALLFGLAVLAQNFAREYFALNGDTAFWELPSVRSMLRQAGPGSLFATNWLAFAADELQRIGLAVAPYAATRFDLQWPGWSLLGGIGLAAIAIAAVLLARRSGGNRGAVLALVPLALVGCFWTIGMGRASVAYRRGFPPPEWDYADIYFESMFHVGAPLALIALTALAVPLAKGPRRSGFKAHQRTAAAGLAVAACVALFVASAFHVSRLQRNPEAAAVLRTLLADGDRIGRVAAGGIIAAPGLKRLGGQQPLPGAQFVRRFLFANHVLTAGGSARSHADFVAAAQIPGASTLTPDNRLLFLYHSAEAPAPRRAEVR